MEQQALLLVSILASLAQYILVPVIQADLTIVDEFVATDRGVGGFGHSGRN